MDSCGIVEERVRTQCQMATPMQFVASADVRRALIDRVAPIVCRLLRASMHTQVHTPCNLLIHSYAQTCTDDDEVSQLAARVQLDAYEIYLIGSHLIATLGMSPVRPSHHSYSRRTQQHKST